MNWTKLLNAELESAYATTGALLDRVDPSSLNWKPHTGNNWMTIGQLLKHISNACGEACKGFVTGDWGLPAGVTVQDLPPEEMMPPAEKLPAVASIEQAKRLLAEDKALAVEMIGRAGESDLSSKKMPAPWAPDGPQSVLGWHLLQMIKHLERHKGQLFYYLKLQGANVNTADLWG